MSALKWERTGDASLTATVGSAECEIGKTKDGWWYSLEVSDEWIASLDEAKSLAEAAIRDMLTGVQQHFAPVLRWERRDDTFVVARLGEWRLFAHPHAWSIDLDCTPVKENEPSSTGLEANKRAAEAALRSLGVAFRVEGE